jgi:hypothetical protein
MTDEERVELLAQALWSRVYGMRRITSRWQAFASANTVVAQQYRTKAQQMLGTAQSATGGPGARRPHSSLGWLA